MWSWVLVRSTFSPASDIAANSYGFHHLPLLIARNIQIHEPLLRLLPHKYVVDLRC